MEDFEGRIIAWLMAIMLACITWAMVRPVLLDRNVIQNFNNVINRQAAQIEKNATDVRNINRDITDLRKGDKSE